MQPRAYETQRLARLRRTSSWSFAAAFVGWLGAFSLAQLDQREAGLCFTYLFLAGGLLSAVTWVGYCLLVFPRWCCYVAARIRALWAGT